jgi:hypothetical protein
VSLALLSRRFLQRPRPRTAGVSPPSSSVGCSARVGPQARRKRRYPRGRCDRAPISSADGRWWLHCDAGRRPGADAVPAFLFARVFVHSPREHCRLLRGPVAASLLPKAVWRATGAVSSMA